MSTRDIYVDPSRLVIVSYEDDDGNEQEVLALTARYVPATLPSGARRVVMQLAYDPAQKNPLAPYYCPRGRIGMRLVMPHRITGIRAYEP